MKDIPEQVDDDIIPGLRSIFLILLFIFGYLFPDRCFQIGLISSLSPEI